MAPKNNKKAPHGAKNKEKKPGKDRSCLVWAAVGAAFFFVLCLLADKNIKLMAVLLGLGALALGLVYRRNLLQRLALPLLALGLFLLVNGISVFYAPSGKLALQEFLKLFASFAAGMILLLAFSARGKSPALPMACVMEVAAAIAALLSIDLLSTRILSGAVLAVLEKLDPYYSNLTAVEAGVRLTSIFEKPNIFAGCAGIGVLLSLGLSMTEAGRGEKRLHLCCLYISSVGFVLAFSMGAVASIALAFVVFILFEGASRRARLLQLMAETLVLTALCAGLVSLTGLDAWDGIRPIPLLALAAGCVLLCLAEERLGSLSDKLRGRGKLAGACALGLVLVLAAYIAAALNISGPVELSAGESLRRAAYPQPGEYSLSLEGDRGFDVSIVSQSRAETMMHTQTVLYSGPVQDAKFTVPQDSTVVYFTLRATGDGVARSMSYEGAESGSVKLGYSLLPDFIANRIQGIFANQNAIQRTVFFEDGLKLFAMSPVFGLGMGAFEAAVQSVQSFHYETKYVHNHYIQVLLETGVLGFAVFMGLLVLCALALVRSRRREDFHPLTPALAAGLVFMAAHALVEVVFSGYSYLPLAFGLFFLINECCALPAEKPALRVKGAAAIAMGLLALVYCVLVVCGMAARSSAQNSMSYRSLAQAAVLDVFEWPDYALTYIMQAANDSSASPDVRAQAEEFAQKLDGGFSNTRYYYLADYYLAGDNVEKGMEMAIRHLENVSSNAEEWDRTIYLLRMHNLSGASFEAGCRAIAEMLDSWNSENMGQISLSPENRSFIDGVLAS